MKNKQIEALEKLIALKDETIKELERQVQLLKNQSPIVVPQFPTQPYNPTNPWLQPIYPSAVPSWYGTISSITNDPNTTVSVTNSDGNTSIIDINDIKRA